MKVFKKPFILLSVIAVLIFSFGFLYSCGTTKGVDNKSDEVSEPGTEETIEEENPLLFEEEEYSFLKEYYKDVTWHSISSIEELNGRWLTPEGTLEFPFILDNKEYLSITSFETDDTAMWEEFAQRNYLSLEEIWENRFVYIPEIYGTDWPVGDENGTQMGIWPEITNYEIINETIVTSTRQIIIPVEIVSQNLTFFKVSDTNDKIKAEGLFRFFSKIFTNLSGSFELTEPHSTREQPPKYGVVLSGGGGKGAYEVGVWKAFDEYGLTKKIRALSGTSVGGLNSALFAIQPYDTIEDIWLSKVPGKLTQNDALISQEGLDEIISSIPLVKLQQMKFPQVYVTAVRNKFLLAKLVKSKPEQYATRFNLNSEPSISQIKKKLLATSAFPIICPSVKLADGFEYSDGGNEAVGGDNTPIRPVTDNHPDIDEIIIVYLAHEPKRMIKEIDFDTKHLIQIVPSIELGGILDGTANFTSSRIKLLIKYGYEDAVKVLKKNGWYPVNKMWFEDKPVSSMEDNLALYSAAQ